MNQYKSQYRSKTENSTPHDSKKHQKKCERELQQLFPSLEVEIVREILEQVNWDVDRAKDHLSDVTDVCPENSLVNGAAALDPGMFNGEDFTSHSFYDQNGYDTANGKCSPLDSSKSEYMTLFEQFKNEGLRSAENKNSPPNTATTSSSFNKLKSNHSNYTNNNNNSVSKTVKEKRTYKGYDTLDLKFLKSQQNNAEEEEDFPVLSPRTRTPTLYNTVINSSASSAIFQSKSETNVHELGKQATKNQWKDGSSSLARLPKKENKTNQQIGLAQQQQQPQQDEDLFTPIDGDDWFTLEVDKKFISDVFQTYSDPIDDIEIDKIKPPSIRIPPDLAFQLYNIVYLQMRKNGAFAEQQQQQHHPFYFNYTPPPEAEEYTEEELNEIIRKSETASSTSPDLQQVMDFEAKLEDQEAFNRSKIPNNIATLLARQKLQAAFPKVNQEIIETCYGANDCKFNVTLNQLKSMYGHLFCPEGLSENFDDGSNNINNNDHHHQYRQEYDSDNIFEGENIEESEIQEHRKAAVTYYQEGKEFVEKANQSGNPAVAAHYRLMAQKHSDLGREENKEAERLIMKRFNSSKESQFQLDLHHLYVPEARKWTQRFLNERMKYLQENNKPSVEVTIITGKGKNSTTGPARLPQQIEVFLIKHGYSFYSGNGNFKVKLKNNNYIPMKH